MDWPIFWMGYHWKGLSIMIGLIPGVLDLIRWVSHQILLQPHPFPILRLGGYPYTPVFKQTNTLPLGGELAKHRTYESMRFKEGEHLEAWRSICNCIELISFLCKGFYHLLNSIWLGLLFYNILVSMLFFIVILFNIRKLVSFDILFL